MKVCGVGVTAGVGVGVAAGFVCALGSGGVPPRGAPATAFPLELTAPLDVALELPLEVIVVAADGEKLAALNSEELKKSRQVASTEFGSAMYFSYISSTSQSLAPKFPLTGGNPIGEH